MVPLPGTVTGGLAMLATDSAFEGMAASKSVPLLLPHVGSGSPGKAHLEQQPQRRREEQQALPIHTPLLLRSMAGLPISPSKYPEKSSWR